MSKPTKMNAEQAVKISNDISEGIDCGEDRQTLRAAIHWWAWYASKTRQEFQSALGHELLAVLNIAAQQAERERRAVENLASAECPRVMLSQRRVRKPKRAKTIVYNSRAPKKKEL